MEQAIILEQNTKTPGPATTIVTEQGVFLYVPNGPGYGVIVPLEGSQGPSRAYSSGGPRDSSQVIEEPYRSPSGIEFAPESPEEPEPE